MRGRTTANQDYVSGRSPARLPAAVQAYQPGFKRPQPYALLKRVPVRAAVRLAGLQTVLRSATLFARRYCLSSAVTFLDKLDRSGTNGNFFTALI